MLGDPVINSPEWRDKASDTIKNVIHQLSYVKTFLGNAFDLQAKAADSCVRAERKVWLQPLNLNQADTQTLVDAPVPLGTVSEDLELQVPSLFGPPLSETLQGRNPAAPASPSRSKRKQRSKGPMLKV